MTKQRLLELSDETLQDLARREGVLVSSPLDREDVIEQILEAIAEDRFERDIVNNLAMRIKEKKYEVVQEDEFISSMEDEFVLPEIYNETKIFLMLRDPFWAFCYWELFPAEAAEVRQSDGGTLLFSTSVLSSGRRVERKKFIQIFLTFPYLSKTDAGTLICRTAEYGTV